MTINCYLHNTKTEIVKILRLFYTNKGTANIHFDEVEYKQLAVTLN